MGVPGFRAYRSTVEILHIYDRAVAKLLYKEIRIFFSLHEPTLESSSVGLWAVASGRCLKPDHPHLNSSPIRLYNRSMMTRKLLVCL